jgi:hypothetical protein
MNKPGVWDLDSPLQHPSCYGGLDMVDVCADLLFRKLCPVHLTPLIPYKKCELGEDYTRVQYGCLSCRCTADYVGDELKSDSVGRTLEIINLMIEEERELSAAKINPAAESGIQV